MAKEVIKSSNRVPYAYELGKFPLCAFAVQMIFTILFAFFVDYSAEANATHYTHEHDPIHGGKRPHENSIYLKYPVFKDVHIMTFVGFGFLFTFLRKYSYSSVGINIFLASILLQWAILCEGFFKLENGIIMLGIDQILSADVAAVSGLISWGALLGKISPLQTLLLAIIEIPVYVCSKWLVISVFKAVDSGGSITCHTFGAYFGLAVSFAIYRKEHKNNPNEKRNEYLNTFAMIGTMFLWLYWPNFNAGGVVGDDRHRAILNTYLALSSSCIMTFAMCSLFHPRSKFNMAYIENGSLAGGIAIGAACSTMLGPYVALIIGSLAGAICTSSLRFLKPFLARTCRLHDTCGVHSVHGLMGVMGGIVSIIMAFYAVNELYGLSVYLIYPAMAPHENTPEFIEIRGQLSLVRPGDGRSANLQAAYQLIALLSTVFISLVGGLITGLLMRFSIFDPPPKTSLFDDEEYWEVSEEESEDSGGEQYESEKLSSQYNRRNTPSINLRPSKTVIRMTENKSRPEPRDV